MKTTLIASTALALLFSCQSPVTEAQIQEAELYFPPKVKYLSEARFSFSTAERKKALLNYTKHGADTLFEFVIDRQGKVKKARLLKTRVKKVYHEDLEIHAEGMEFSEDDGPAPYRAFYYPTDYTFRPTFEWVGD